MFVNDLMIDHRLNLFIVGYPEALSFLSYNLGNLDMISGLLVANNLVLGI